MAEAPPTTWYQRGRNTIAAKNPNAARKTEATDTVNARLRNSSSGTIGSAARDSTQMNPARTTSPRPISPPTAGSPQSSRLLVGQPDEDRHERGGEQGGTRVVDPGPPTGRMVAGQVAPDREQHDSADRQVDEEDERPADRVRDQPADRRADEARQPEDRAEQALVPTALRRREQVGDRRHRDREQRTGAEALDAASADELPHLARQPGQDRAGHEQADPEQEDRPPAEQVGQLAVERTADRRGQQVGGERPGVEAVAAEVGDDPWERRPDDGLVEGGKEDADHDRAEDAHPDGVGELDRRPIGRSEGGLHGFVGHTEHLTARLG